jgi:SEC-C motif
MSYLQRFEPHANDPCVCGSGRKFKRCCKNRYGADARATDKYNEGRYKEALVACRAHLTWYILCHKAHTAPLVKKQVPDVQQLLDLDIGALAYLVDLLYSCYRKTGLSGGFPTVLAHLQTAIDDPRWRDRLCYFRALWALADGGDEAQARKELAAIRIDTIDDFDTLALYLEVYADQLGIEVRLRLFDTITNTTKDPAHRLHYSVAKGVALSLICELKKGIASVRQATQGYLALDSDERSTYGDFVLARALFVLAELSGEKKVAAEALAQYRDLWGSSQRDDYTQAYFAELAKCMGDCYSFIGQFADGIQRYQESLALETSALTELFLARAHANAGEPDTARTLLEKMETTSLNAAGKYDYAISWAVLAAVSLDQKDLDRARDELKRLQPSAPLFHQQRNEALIRLLETRPAVRAAGIRRMLSAFNRYISLNPNMFGIGVNFNKIIEDLDAKTKSQR